MELDTSLTDAILSEILGIMGLGGRGWARRALGPLFHLPVRRLAAALARLDQDVSSLGFSAAAGRLLSGFVRGFHVHYAAALPPDGPLLVASNHPGAYDLLMLVAALARDDLKIISSEIAIIRCLPAVAPHFIPIGSTPQGGMAAFRAGLRHLSSGGSLFIFPRGDVEPDPALSPGYARSLQAWSPSLELLLRRAAHARVVVAAVSGVISPYWFHHPLPRRWKKPEQRQKIAEIFQVAAGLLRAEKFPPPACPLPQVCFSPPLSLPPHAPPGALLQVVLDTARAQLASLEPAPSNP